MLVTALGYVTDTGYDDKKTGIRHHTMGVTAYVVLAARPKSEAAKPADEPVAPVATMPSGDDKVAPVATPIPASVPVAAPAPAFTATPAF